MTPTTTIRATMSKKNCKDCAFSLGDIQKVRLSLRGRGRGIYKKRTKTAYILYVRLKKTCRANFHAKKNDFNTLTIFSAQILSRCRHNSFLLINNLIFCSFIDFRYRRAESLTL